MAEEEKKVKKKATGSKTQKKVTKETSAAKKTSTVKKATTSKKQEKKVVKKVETKVAPKKVETKKVEVPKKIESPKKVEVKEETKKVELPKKVEAKEPVAEVKESKKQKKKSRFTTREKILIGAMLLTIVITAIMYYLMFGAKYYSFKVNWGIIVPSSTEEIYTVKGKKDEFGDYNTYYVLKYEDEKDIENMVSWVTSDGETVQYNSYIEASEQWLNVLGVETKNRPNYTGVVYYYKNDSKSNELIIINNKEEKKIYILEFFMKEE